MACPLSKQETLELYRQILLIRKCEECIRAEYPRDEMKTPVHLCNGAEAIAVGVVAALPKGFKVFGTYRNHGFYLAITDDADSFFSELYGREDGCLQGKGGSMHLAFPEKGLCITSAVVATTIPVAVGAAFSNAYRGSKDCVAVFFGDGALDEGAFWESLNFACLKKLRILFICEDNNLAIHALGTERRGYRSITDIVRGFDCYVGASKGYCPNLVYQSTQEAMEKMKRDPKPAFLHFEYFRFLEHVGISEDFRAGYREKPDEKTLATMDPVLNAKRLAIEAGWNDAELLDIEKKIDARIKRSIQKAKEAPFPTPDKLLQNVFSSSQKR